METADNPEHIAQIRRVRRAKAANVDEQLLDDDDWKAARKFQESKSELDDSEAFNLNAEDTQGRFDDEGYFLFDNKIRVNDKRLVWGDKQGRNRVKRQLGIDDEDEFVERKLRKVEFSTEKMMRVRSQRSLDDKEYSDDEEEVKELERLQNRDSWLDDVDQGNIREVKMKVIERKKQEIEETEKKLLNRSCASLSDTEKLSKLIAMLESDSQSPADLMRLIKERDVVADRPAAEKVVARGKKVFQRPRKLTEASQKSMNMLVDLCDELTMQGIREYFSSVSWIKVL
eukprot:Gregarina_sp_Poly_1__3866@NODE_2154_length_2589_cov_46_007137_g1388_i0_p1_GENE_NODE_2154_length_2589_cov_46_007137_g1388_i0NODE_2154_length_2589_cov_46_007137_g1388_i0_p1_ORF_typecomplete_len286_score72_12DUF1639/PF07797_14/1_8e04DUF1639/PF07797_14/0_064FYVE_2/PF02318_16/9_7FYVE_2/PF02318_16/2_6e02_NODE_2154_length_2589_cov_46_007137_g1388_i09631820